MRTGDFGNPLGVVDATTVDPATASASPPNWVTARRYSSTSRSPVRRPRTHRSSRRPSNCRSPGTRPSARRGGSRTRHAGQYPSGAGRHRAGQLRRRPHRDERAGGLGTGVRDPRTGFGRRTAGRRPGRLPRRRRALPVDMDRSGQRVLRSRMFAADLGVPEDEATGSAAVRITDYLSRDLTIMQGKGSEIQTEWSSEGWVGSPAGSSATGPSRSTDRPRQPERGDRGARAAPRSRARNRRPRRTTGRPTRTGGRRPRRDREAGPGSPVRPHGWGPRANPSRAPCLPLAAPAG